MNQLLMEKDSDLRLFCCPQCQSEKLAWAEKNRELPRRPFQCLQCHLLYTWEDGIFDFLGVADKQEFITPFQRLMQFPPVAAVYEKFWRPTGFFIASSSSFWAFSRKLLALIPAGQELILDLACGPGLFTLPLAEKTKGRVVACDLSMPMLRQTKRALETRGISNVLLVRGSALSLPFPLQTFDSILCSGALHLFERPELALREISRSLKPPGQFICQTTLKPRHSAGLATFLDKIIRFGFFPSVAAVSQQAEAAGLLIDYQWQQRIIFLFRAHKL